MHPTRPLAVALACLLVAALPARAQHYAEPGRFAPPAGPFPFRQTNAEEPVGSATAAGHSPLKLAPRSAAHPAVDRPTAGNSGQAIGSVVGSLAIVLGLFLAAAWLSRRFAPAGSAPLPKEAVESLGRAPLAGRQSMQLVRVGNKLLLLAVSTAGAETLTEITDPVEVEHLAALCRRGRADSATATFTQIMGQLAAEPAGTPRSRTGGAP
jgi:flagellar biogenesis protein FliO